MADRVLVMHEGRLTGELSRAEADEESVIRASHGAAGGRGRVSVDATSAAPPPLESERARRLVERVFRVRELGIVVALALLIAVTAILEPRFIETDVAAQPRAQRVDLRDPRRRPDARDRHPQRRPLGRLGRRPQRVHGRRPALQPPRHGAAARVPGRDRARGGLRSAQRAAHHLGPGAGARRDAGNALRVPRPRVPVDERAPGQRRDAARLVPEHRHRHRARRPLSRGHRARRRARRRAVAARLPRRPRAVCDRLEPRGRAPGRRALGPPRADRVRAGRRPRRARRCALHRALRARSTRPRAPATS